MDGLENSAEDQFKQQLLAIYNSTKKSVLMKKDDYFSLIEELRNASKEESKTPRQYYIIKKFQILQCGDVEKLIRKSTDPSHDPVYYTHMEDMYDIIKRAHIATGHGGRDKMLKVLTVKYANITSDAIELYKSLCIECIKKRKRHAIKGVVVRPILSRDYGSRGQVDLIDMQSMPSGQYKWIMVYQDHLTKYCVLRPLSTKRAAEVAYQLMDIFLLFGAPQILQSDNGSEFTASVITELKLLWPDLLMVHGKPRHPQSQGSVERLNCDVKDMLIAWLGDNQSTDWSVGLKFVQFSKNTSYHTGIKQSPYLALFGGNPRVGLRSTALPTEILERMVSEDDLIAAFNPHQTSDDASNTTTVGSTPTTPSASSSAADITQTTSSASGTAVDIAPTASNTSNDTIDNAPASSEVAIEPNQEQINMQRKRARASLVQQAERMVKRSRVVHAPGHPGDNVTVPIPMVDRGRGDPRNIMGVIMDRDDNDMYRIAVRAGLLKGKYSRNQFDLCVQKLLKDTDVSKDQEVALRTAVQMESLCGGQGFVKCNCAGTGRCQSNRCKCFKANVKCNSRCHASLSCDNKT
jgi:transposase InsO family protein